MKEFFSRAEDSPEEITQNTAQSDKEVAYGKKVKGY